MPQPPHVLQRTLADMQQSWHILHGTLGDMPRSEIGFCIFGLEFITIRKAGVQSRIFNLLRTIALCRPLECLIQLRKYSVGRHDAQSNRSLTNLGQEWLFSERRKHSVARHSALFSSSEYSVSRHNANSNCGNTLSAVTMLYPLGASILSAVIMLYPIAEEL